MTTAPTTPTKLNRQPAACGFCILTDQTRKWVDSASRREWKRDCDRRSDEHVVDADGRVIEFEGCDAFKGSKSVQACPPCVAVDLYQWCVVEDCASLVVICHDCANYAAFESAATGGYCSDHVDLGTDNKDWRLDILPPTDDAVEQLKDAHDRVVADHLARKRALAAASRPGSDEAVIGGRALRRHLRDRRAAMVKAYAEREDADPVVVDKVRETHRRVAALFDVVDAAVDAADDAKTEAYHAITREAMSWRDQLLELVLMVDVFGKSGVLD